MKHARDTFLHLLADNLPTFKVHNLRFDSKHPHHSEYAQNAINVEFVADRFGALVSSLLVSIDLLYNDEFLAIQAMTAICRILGCTEIVPLLSYDDNPAAPVKLGPMLRWNSKSIKFNKLESDLNFNYNCRLTLFYSDPTLLPSA